jgi:hypothetical protein
VERDLGEAVPGAFDAVWGRGYSSTTEQRSFVVTDPGLAPRVASFLGPVSEAVQPP